ncbi:MAG: hypothetical protein LRY62_02245 [Alphaproteobacteria bacterium]|nr:hypothetical protein [Alphaproteobacteria bacterium]
MRWPLFLLAALLLCLPFSSIPVWAEDSGDMALEFPKGTNPPPTDMVSHIYNPKYDFMVRKAVVTWPRPFNFQVMRAFYANTRQYDPLGESTLKKLAELSYAVETAGNQQNKERLAGEYKDLVLNHLAHIDVVLQALSLARDNPLYGDPAFYEWVVKGLENEILSSTKGRTMRDAYSLVTMGEEALILNRLGAKSVYMELVSDGLHFYNIHLAEDFETHKQYELFMDTTRPMRRLKNAYNAVDGPARKLDLRASHK